MKFVDAFPSAVVTIKYIHTVACIVATVVVQKLATRVCICVHDSANLLYRVLYTAFSQKCNYHLSQRETDLYTFYKARHCFTEVIIIDARLCAPRLISRNVSCRVQPVARRTLFPAVHYHLQLFRVFRFLLQVLLRLRLDRHLMCRWAIFPTTNLGRP